MTLSFAALAIHATAPRYAGNQCRLTVPTIRHGAKKAYAEEILVVISSSAVMVAARHLHRVLDATGSEINASLWTCCGGARGIRTAGLDAGWP